MGNISSDTVSGFLINPTTGYLTPLPGSPYVVPTHPQDPNRSSYPGLLAMAPDGQFLFVASTSKSTLHSFRVNPDGSLTYIQPPAALYGGTVDRIRVSPDGKYLFASENSNERVTVHAINTQGQVLPGLVSSFSESGEDELSPIEMNCAGSLLFAPSTKGLNVLNVSSTGVLSPRTGSPFPFFTSEAVLLSLSVDEKYLFGANLNTAMLSVWALGVGGQVAPVPGSTVSIGDPNNEDRRPIDTGVSRDGQFYYVLSPDGYVLVFTVSPDGLLSQVPGSPFLIPGGAGYGADLLAYPPKGCPSVTADTDGDGIPDVVELQEGTDPFVRDNDVFANARLFVMQQYRDFLGREGDAGGVSFWTGEINSGRKTRAQVTESFFNSAEFSAVNPVARLYFAYFLRIPDYDGLLYWVNQYRAGQSLDFISQAFAQSPEFISRYGNLTNSQFVELVYQNVLGRAADAAGLAYWTAELDSGRRTRGQVMLEFSEGIEFRGRSQHWVFVVQMYVGMLRRSPEQLGFDYWVGQLASGRSGLELIQGFLDAPEYRGRFLP